KQENKKEEVKKEQTNEEYLLESLTVLNNQLTSFFYGVTEINLLLDFYDKKDDKDKPKFVNRMNELLREKKGLNERIKAGRYDLEKVRNILKIVKEM
ncbi:MAG TPA: hypothetical protein VGB37_00390, partial [Candidatus Lokiarchaeia archaeon]